MFPAPPRFLDILPHIVVPSHLLVICICVISHSFVSPAKFEVHDTKDYKNCITYDYIYNGYHNSQNIFRDCENIYWMDEGID